MGSNRGCKQTRGRITGMVNEVFSEIDASDTAIILPNCPLEHCLVGFTNIYFGSFSAKVDIPQAFGGHHEAGASSAFLGLHSHNSSMIISETKIGIMDNQGFPDGVDRRGDMMDIPLIIARRRGGNGSYE